MTQYVFIIETTGDDLTQLYPAHICEPFSFIDVDGDVERYYTSTTKPDALKAILNQDSTVKAYHIEDETDNQDAGEYGMTCVVCNEPATERTDNGEWFCSEHFPRPRMGRPPVEERRESQQVMLEPRYIDQIEELARKAGMTKSAWMRDVILKALDR